MKKEKDKLSQHAGFAGTADNDERLGQVLSNGLREAGTGRDTCLPAEDIAALVEGRVGSEERDHMMKHLSACDTCYDIFLLAADLHGEEEREAGKRIVKPSLFKPLALAASILIVVVSIYIFYTGRDIPKTSRELLDMSAPKEAKPESAERERANTPVRIMPKKGAPAASGLPVEKKKDFRNIPPDSAKEGGRKAAAENKERNEAFKDDGLQITGKTRTARPRSPASKKMKTAPTYEIAAKKAPETMKPRLEKKGDLESKTEEEEADKVEKLKREERRVTTRKKGKAGGYRAPQPTKGVPRDQVQIQQQQMRQQQMQKQQVQQQQVQQQEQQAQPIQQESVGQLQKSTLDESAPGQHSADLRRISMLNAIARTHPVYLSSVKIQNLFTETLELSLRLKAGTGAGEKSADQDKKLNRFGFDQGELKPLINMVNVRESVYIYPNIDYFLSKSAPGTLENRFFSLARSGWCDKTGNCYGKNGSAPGWVGKNKALGTALLPQWERLYPKLSGIFKEIAGNTISNLKQR
jgi:hypothetical protein